MAEKLSVGLIGAGGIARAHANACAQVDEVELVAVSDVLVEHARRLGDEWGVDACYDSVESMLIDQSLDIAILCMWGSFTHRWESSWLRLGACVQFYARSRSRKQPMKPAN